MKIPAFLTCLLVALLAAVPLHRAHADDVNFDVFYNSLADDGDWYNTPEYGYVWQPYIAYKSDKWRPYTDGYWAQTDDGWTWVSYENFGWATYHYGRWTRLKDLGWAWVPGYDWGPGWVSWRTNNDYVGWAPLPPKFEEGVSDGATLDTRREQIDYNDVEPVDAGYSTNVDAQYDIGPANYCFVDTRNFGAPVLSEVLLPPQQNVVFIERTTNVTNIYYQRQGSTTVVFNNGPDFAFINSHVERPIPRLQLDRHDDPGFLTNGLRGGGNPTLVRNGVLNVATPVIARRPMNFTQFKPARVKQTLSQPQVVRGWSNSGADQAVAQRIRAQYKQQAAAAPARPANPVIPPGVPERERTERAAGNTPPAPVAGAQPFESRQPGGQPATAPHGALTEDERLARRDAQQKARDQRAGGQGPAPAAQGAPNPAVQPNADQDKEARRAARQAARANGQPPAQAATPAPAAQGTSDQDKEARRAARQAARANGQPPAAPEGNPPQPANAPSESERATKQPPRQPEQARPPAAPQADNAQADQEREARRAARQQERAAQPAAQPQAAAPDAQQEREARRAARQQERAAQPAAQPQAAAPDAQQEQEARRAARQQERAAQPERQPQPERQAQPERQPQPDRQTQPERQPQAQTSTPARETHRDDQGRQGKPGQSPNP